MYVRCADQLPWLEGSMPGPPDAPNWRVPGRCLLAWSYLVPVEGYEEVTRTPTDVDHVIGHALTSKGPSMDSPVTSRGSWERLASL